MKKMALILAMTLTVALAGCGSGNKAADSEKPFEGKYVVDAEYVKEHLDDITLVDARGEDEAKKGTVKGAIATTWQYLATCEDGEAGDEVEVDFDSGKIYNRTKGTEFQGQAFPEFMQKLIAAGGLVNYTNSKKKKD